MKILTSDRILFLVVWSPIVLLSSMCLLGNVGRELQVRYSIDTNVLTLDYFIPFFVVMGFMSMFLFVIVGLEDVG